MGYSELLKIELLKQRKSFIYPISLLTPILAGALTFINLFLRHDYLKGLEANRGLSSWNLMLMQHHFLWFILLSLVVTLLASMMHFIEYKSNSWKSILALPVSRSKVYLAKLLIVYILSAFIILFNSLILVLVGIVLGFTDSLDYNLLMSYTLLQLIAITSLISFQSFISAQISNTSISLTIGFVGASSSLFFAQSELFSKLLPYTHIIYTLPDPTIDNSIPLRYGLTFGVVFLVIGIRFFNRKEFC